MSLEFPWLSTREAGFLELWNSTNGDENQKRLIEYLVHSFLYVDSDLSNEFCRLIADQITQKWKLKPSNTFVSAACDNSKPDGSQLMVQKLKNHFPYGWYDYDFVNSLPVAVHKLHNNDNLVICDDFIGTGKTLKGKIQYVNKIIAEKGLNKIGIYIVAFAAMSFSRADLHYPLYACRYMPKGISETLTGNKLLIATRIMQNMEGLLKSHIRGLYLPRFGYGRSESLYNFEGDNIPNNVFPIFWWKKYADDSLRMPMFRRI